LTSNGWERGGNVVGWAKSKEQERKWYIQIWSWSNSFSKAFQYQYKEGCAMIAGLAPLKGLQKAILEFLWVVYRGAA
jgi:hypothetical protein